MKTDSLQFNRAEAERFLTALDPKAKAFTFQTFDDDKERDKRNEAANKKYKSPYARIYHGSLAKHWDELVDLNKRGAGIFVTVNETDFKGRKITNIKRIRAGFSDLDGAPLAPVLADKALPPHIVVESSPDRWHTYWLANGVALKDFAAMQKALAARFNGDDIHDLPRVMRLPGFFHRKDPNKLIQVKIHSIKPGRPYSGAALLVKLAPPKSKPQAARVDQEPNTWSALNTAALQNLEAWVPELFPDATPYHGNGFRVSSASLGRDLEEDISLVPEGIKDFGVHDTGDPREGKRSPIDIVMEHGKKDFHDAGDWLRQKLGLPQHDDGLTPEQKTEIGRLAKLSLIQYDQERIQAAERLGIRVGTLDQLVEHARPASTEKVGQGTPLNLAAIEPWPESVDGEKLVTELTAVIRKHIVLNEQQALAVALWVLHAHALEYAEHSPRLHVSSPAPRCGKTTLLNTVAALVPKPIHTENITTSALFRIMELQQPTLLIDEADIFLNDNEDIRGMLNAGHSRSGQVIRTVGEDFEPRAFKVWGPVVVAGIGRIPATIEDRSITIPLRRRLPNEQIERLRTNRTMHLVELARRGARWVADHKIALANADPVLPESLGDRQRDNWRPLVAIADAISKELSQRVKDAAIAIASEEVDEENKSIMALADVAAIFELKNTDKISSEELVQTLIDMEDRPWAEWRRGQPMTKNSLARLLKPFSIHPKPIRFDPKPAATRSGYLAGPIAEAKSRYVDHEVTLTEEEPEESAPSSPQAGIPRIKPKPQNPPIKPGTSLKTNRNPGFGLKGRIR